MAEKASATRTGAELERQLTVLDMRVRGVDALPHLIHGLSWVRRRPRRRRQGVGRPRRRGGRARPGGSRNNFV